jgi:transcriptional regulator with XRE-family HTH domain
MDKGWTQDEFANRARVSKRTLERIERGDPVYPATLALLARALGVESISILTVEDQPDQEKESDQHGAAKSLEPRITISIQISGDLETFRGERLEELISALSKIARISSTEIKLEDVREA